RPALRDSSPLRRIPPPVGLLTPAAAALVGDTVFVQGQPKVVIGILNADPEERQRFVYLPIGAAAELGADAFGVRPPALAVKVGRVEEATPVRQRAEQWLKERFGNWEGRVSVSTNRSRVEQVEQSMLIFKLLMGALTGVSLLVGGIGIM